MTNMKIFMIFFTVATLGAAEPATILLTNGYWTSPLTSAALVQGSPILAPAASVTPVESAQSAPVVVPVTPVAQGASMLPVAPVAPISSVSDYQYAYGSAYNYQDNMVYSAYTLPYTSLPYAQWFYRK